MKAIFGSGRVAIAALLLASLLAVIGGVGAASAGASTIGYVYAGSLSAGSSARALQDFAVGEHGELTLVGSTAVSNEYVTGVAVAPTESGTYVYVVDGPRSEIEGSTIDEFKVNPADGSLSPIGKLTAPELCGSTGNKLYVYDEEGTGPARLFAPGCIIGHGPEASGIRDFTIDPATGALTDDGHRYFEESSFAGMAIAGNELSYAYEGHGQTEILYATISASTGEPTFVGSPYALDDGAAENGKQKAFVGAAAPGLFTLGNLHPFSQTEPSVAGISTYGFGSSAQGIAIVQGAEVEALAYTPSWLIAGERGPRLEILGIGQTANGGPVIDLTQPPTSLPVDSGSEFDDDGIDTIYSLGPFLYVGVYLERTVELVDEPAEAVALMSAPFASGNGGESANTSVDAMAGFLTGTPTKSEPTGGEGGGAGVGTKSPSGPTGPPTNTGPVAGTAGGKLHLSGAGKVKLKSGYIKLEVTCGLPCTVAGSVSGPAAKVSSAHKSKALAFKSVAVPGSGQAVVVKLRFTRAQRQLITRLLRKHEKVTAKITVTESSGGAPPQSKVIRIT